MTLQRNDDRLLNKAGLDASCILEAGRSAAAWRTEEQTAHGVAVRVGRTG